MALYTLTRNGPNPANKNRYGIYDTEIVADDVQIVGNTICFRDEKGKLVKGFSMSVGSTFVSVQRVDE